MKCINSVLIGLFLCLLACSDGIVYYNPNAAVDSELSDDVEEDPSDPAPPVIPGSTSRQLWASINGRADACDEKFSVYNQKILVSWRFFPTDPVETAFDLYRSAGGGEEVKLNERPITGVTNFQDNSADRSVDNTYRLCYAGSVETLDMYTLSAQRASEGLPYISIPLRSTADLSPSLIYRANDVSIGDLDGDGQYEIVLKRLVEGNAGNEDILDVTTGTMQYVRHYMLLEAYKLDGAFMWRMALGPNVLTGNGGSFAVYDFNGDGRCEIALRTAEGTIFGDGSEIGDTDGDGKTDYRVEGANHIHGGPEFLSVVDGLSGKELARTDYIALGTSEDWGDDYYKRSSSYRVAMAHCAGSSPSIIIGRGCYAKIVVEAWNLQNGDLVKQWRFDTTDGIHASYEAQGYHSLSVADVDGDGWDEIVYGSCTIDHNGRGLNNCRLGHGDALHVGKFDPSRKGLQIWSCFETGSVGAAFRDAASGKVIWKFDSPNDIGRCLVADIDPDSPGCEMWWYRSNAHSPQGQDLGYAPKNCNMAVWWSGSLNRQLLDKSTIDSYKDGRVFTIHRYNVTTINGTKSNPCFYADMVGDWREEIIQPTNENDELRIFSTWYPTEHRFPYLMSDHVYEMSALNQNVGYNQPTHTSYYLGSDLLNNK